jgi:hypothetical protein
MSLMSLYKNIEKMSEKAKSYSGKWQVRFSEDVVAMIHVWVVPIRDVVEEAERAEKEKAQEAAEKEADKFDPRRNRD